MKVIKGEPGAKDKTKAGDSEEPKELDNNWKTEMRNGICVIKKVDLGAATTAAKKDAASSAESEGAEESHEDGDGAGVGSGDGEGGGVGWGGARRPAPKRRR